MALAAGTFAAINDSFMSIISAGAAVILTGAAMAAFTASFSLSKSSSEDETVEDYSTADAFVDSTPELRLADFLENPKSLRSDSSRFEEVSHVDSEPPLWMESTNTETDSWQQSTSPPEMEEHAFNSIPEIPSFSSPLEVVNDGAYINAVEQSAYSSEDVYHHKPLVPATALYSSKGAQLDAAPVPLRTKIERIKAELDLHDKFFEEL